MNAFFRLIIRLIGVWLAAFVVLNRRSLIEGIGYLRDLRRWNPADGTRLKRNGQFGSCYDLVALTNHGRYRYICTMLQSWQVRYEELPIAGEELPNLVVYFGAVQPRLLLVAHYDKSRETVSYQGASDNTAALAVLLAAIQGWIDQPPAQSVAIVFSAAEERGLLGAQAFLAEAKSRGWQFDAVLNIDMLGRDRLAIRPSAMPGFYVAIPLFGLVVYDGRTLRRAVQYQKPESRLIRRMKQLGAHDLIVYQRFTARSDSNIFHEAGIPTVSLSSSNMYYLDLIWERDTDRVELLDAHNLEMALTLVRRIVADSQ
jgi:hypothetical protein